MTFWDGTRWIDQSKPKRSPRGADPRGRSARLADIFATLGMVLILGALFVPFTSVLATGPTLTVSPTSGAPGTTILVTGAVFPAGSKVQVAWDGSSSSASVAQVNRGGTFKTRMIVPADSTGPHTISAAEVLTNGSKAALVTSTALAGVAFTVTQEAADAGPGLETAAPLPDPTPAGETPAPGDTPAPAVTDEPTSEPTADPTADPTARPTARPTPDPTPRPTPDPTPDPTPPPVTYTFHDSFNSLGGVWQRHFHCCGVIAGYDASLSSVSNGVLSMEVDQRSGGWYADLIDTKTTWTQKYGYFEARIKIPKGPGLWPAFWTYYNTSCTRPRSMRWRSVPTRFT